MVRGEGVEINFEGADVQTVAKTLLGDVLKLNFVVDPRVQGNVTLASVGPIPRKDVLPAFESVLRMSNAAIVRDGNLVKIVPMPEAGGDASIRKGAGEPGFGVSLVPLRYTSAATVAKTAESFLSRPGAIRVIPVAKPAADPGHDLRTSGRARRGRDLRRGMAAAISRLASIRSNRLRRRQ